MSKYLIVGLGNPGYEYENTRHNVGFNCIDILKKKLNIDLDQNKFKGSFGVYTKGEKKFYIAKPETYMNNSGFFVIDIINFYKIPVENIIVVYDDIDTEVGKIRLRAKGSSGGQNGLKNIINLLKTENIKRIRIGIGKPKHDLVKHVLSRFELNDLVNIQIALNKASDALADYMNNEQTFDKLMNKYNL